MSEISGNNPKYVTASTQTRKTKMPDFANQVSPIPTKISKFRSVAEDVVMQNVSDKKRSSMALETEKANSDSYKFRKPSNRP